MGWCSATDIFDSVCSALLDEDRTSKEEVIERLISSLEDGDWDCQEDSAYLDHPLVRKIFKKRDPSWFEKEDA